MSDTTTGIDAMRAPESDCEWNQRARAGDLAGAVEAFVRHRDWVSYVEIQQMLDPYIPTEGDLILASVDDPNLIYWAGVSAEFVAVIQECQGRGLIFKHPACWLTYCVDGGGLSFPLARRRPAGGYREPHWCPVCFRTRPL